MYFVKCFRIYVSTGEYPPKEFLDSVIESLINFWNQYSEEIDILAKIILEQEK